MLFGPATIGRRRTIMNSLKEFLKDNYNIIRYHINRLPQHRQNYVRHCEVIASAAIAEGARENIEYMSNAFRNYRKRKAEEQKEEFLRDYNERKKARLEAAAEQKKRFLRGSSEVTQTYGGIQVHRGLYYNQPRNFETLANGDTTETAPEATPMDVHGDAADGVDRQFNRDQEDEKSQKMVAASLWHKAPRIFDDEIIVRLPLGTSNANSFGSTAAPTFFTYGAIRLNDAYKPLGWTSTQGKGFYWYSQLYAYYQVLECRVTYDIIFITPTTSVFATSNTNALTADLPIEVGYQLSAAGQEVAPTNVGQWRGLAINNPAAKTTIFSNIQEMPLHLNMNQSSRVQLSYTWTPAMFDDLEVDITRQPLTAIGGSPNWLNYGDLLLANANTVFPTISPVAQVILRMEQLVHFKKIPTTNYFGA